MKLRPLAVVLLLAGVFLCAPVAWADEEAPEGLEAKIKKKMAEIRELMRKNEEALLALSTGKSAEPKAVEVPVPEGKDASGSKGADGAGKLDELIKGTRANGGRIPDELKRLVEMIPL